MHQDGTHKRVRAWLLAAVLGLGIALAAGGILAQSGYELSWFTVGGGGGSSQGGGYTLSGTAGQAQAGQLAGGGYTLQGGFWAGSSQGTMYVPLLRR